MSPPGASDRLTPDRADVDRFRSDWDRTPIAYGSAPVLIAVSGGADSLALLMLAKACLDGRCHAATVDHGLRAEAAAEARAVAQLCRERDIPHLILRARLPPRVGGTANLSARARALRYALLKGHANAIGACRIATAHHADDQLETLVMRLNRGSGVGGLAGIRFDDGEVVRPVLRWRRGELARVARACGLSPVDDPSNDDDRFDRARLRKALASADWLDVGRAALSAQYLAEADEALALMAEQAAADQCRFGPGLATMRAVGMVAELRRRLVERCILHIRPEARLRGSAVARAVAALAAEEPITIADVLCDIDWHPLPDEARYPVWRFRPAPPRRAG